MNEQSTAKSKITFLPANQATRVPAGTSVFNAAAWLGLPIESTCGGRGTCGKCRVRFEGGGNSITGQDRRFLSEEELSQGWRLSCCTAVHDQQELVVHVPRLMAKPKTATVGVGRPVLLEPNIHKIYLHLPEPTLEDPRADYPRLVEALEAEGYAATADLAMLRTLPRTLRNEADFSVTAVLVGDQLVAVEPGDTRAFCYGLAFDIGTTTVVGNLIDLNQGTTVAVASDLNAQAVRGGDVISRISYTMDSPEHVTELHQLILQTLNGIIDRLLAESEVSVENIYEITVAGNATMLHLLLELDPWAISVYPFVPVIVRGLSVRASELGLNVLPRAMVYLFPIIGAYVGGDIVAVLLATDLPRDKKIRLVIDVGTNGEIVLGSQAWSMATAAPAGPAFEGAEISCGMRAAAGAIEGMVIDGDVHLQVIGDVPPVGVCGSGMIDILAQLYKAGLVDRSGRMLFRYEAEAAGLPAALCRRIIEVNEVVSFVLAWGNESGEDRDIIFTQKDIRALQFGKGAIASGVALLQERMNIRADQIDEVLLAGAFGSYINPESARTIGLVPPQVPVERIRAIGNAAGEGAKIALLSYRERQVAEAIPDMVEYMELSGRVDFNDVFMAVLPFPPLA